MTVSAQLQLLVIDVKFQNKANFVNLSDLVSYNMPLLHMYINTHNLYFIYHT